MPDRELLEAYPLYRTKEIELPRARSNWPSPAIKAPCGFCGSSQTFNMMNSYQQFETTDYMDRVTASQGEHPSPVVRLVYGCASCDRSRRYYLVQVLQAGPRPTGGLRPPDKTRAARAQKVGQYPPYDIAPDPTVARKLKDSTSTFKKGLVCESQGYGVGAFAYYRRILEGLIDDLLEDIEQLVPAEEQEEYHKALSVARESHIAAEKIDLVKDLLPATLRPSGTNPLSLLYSTLSEGLHNLSDEECLERAISTREVLTFLLYQVEEVRQSGELFQEHMKRLLDKRGKS